MLLVEAELELLDEGAWEIAPLFVVTSPSIDNGRTATLPSTLNQRQLSVNCQIETPSIDGK